MKPPRDWLVKVPGDTMHDVDASDPWDLTRAEIECRRLVRQLVRFHRARIPGCEDEYLAAQGFSIGVRETRRIKGEYVVTEDDFRSARKFPDGVSRASWYMDLHDGDVKTPEYKAARSLAEGEFYEIPYRALVPLRVDGLLVAGRCVSSDRMANGSLRVIPTCMNLGEAAGTAAAMAAACGVEPRAINGREIRARLVAAGAEL
jgi:hypothetical protein